MKILISLFFALLFITFGVQYFSNGSASAAMEEGTALVAIKTPESYSQNAQIGQRLFEAKCADCHGPNAVGQAGVAPPLIHIIYEPNHHGDESFQRAVGTGRTRTPLEIRQHASSGRPYQSGSEIYHCLRSRIAKT
jgi:cytochrome c